EGLEKGGRGGTSRYMEMQSLRNSVRMQQINTSYRYERDSRPQNMNGPREGVVVGSYMEPQTRRGEIVTAVLNLLDANGVGQKLVELQVSVMQTETVSINGLGALKSEGSGFV